MFFLSRPAYSIPSSLDDVKKMFGNLCYEYELEFCAVTPQAEKRQEKRKEFTETEKIFDPNEVYKNSPNPTKL